MSRSIEPISFAPVAVAALRGAIATVVATAVRGWAAYWNRRAVRKLLHVDDHMLRDIGLTRGDVECALSSSILVDPSTRLRILAVERRAGRRAQAREVRAHLAECDTPSIPSVGSPVRA